MKCGWLLLVSALIAPFPSMGDVKYTFDFSGTTLTQGKRVILTYTVPSTTAAGDIIEGATQTPR
jgi:hypothetical protein